MNSKFSFEELQIMEQLEACGSKMAKLKAELEEQSSLETDLERKLLVLRAQASPINRIPPELLLQIFKDLGEENELYLRSVILACRKWNEIAISSSSLWSIMSFHLDSTVPAIKCNTLYARSAIRYSGNHPLDVSINFPQERRFATSLAERLVENQSDSGIRSRNTTDWLDACLTYGVDAKPMLYDDILGAILEFIRVVVGNNGENMLCFRSLSLGFSMKEFPDWLNYSSFHCPTPLLEELVIEARDAYDEDIAHPFPAILVHTAPKLSQITCNYEQPLNSLLGSSNSLTQLRLSFKDRAFIYFPNNQYMRNLRILCIVSSTEFFLLENQFREKVVLPMLEKLTSYHTYSPDLIEAPRITTLQLFGHRDYSLYFKRAPLFPYLRRLHLMLRYTDAEDMEEVQRYIKRLPELIHVSLVDCSEARVKDWAARLTLRGGVSIKGYKYISKEEEWDSVCYQKYPSSFGVELSDA